MKRPGYCTLCDKPVFETVGDRLVNPLVPHDDAWRVNFLLSDETNADITFCGACVAMIDEEMNQIWEICLEAFDTEEKQRSGKTPEPVAEFLAHAHEQHLVKEVSRVRWAELKQAGVI